ncbi:MAG: hypothetical protein V7K53_06495 [Nostoc sp.]|uniref:hypothetical protein n=1 Tax=Nostoc sp. TaxID=1180 RepID=UPI002FF9559D
MSITPNQFRENLKLQLKEIKKSLQMASSIDEYQRLVEKKKKESEDPKLVEIITEGLNFLLKERENHINFVQAKLLDKFPLPLSWISINTENTDNDKKRIEDIKHYEKVIEYCIIFGNTDLLDQWGIYSLCNSNIINIRSKSQYIQNYTNIFQQLLDEKLKKEKDIPQKVYFQYLIKAFEYIIDNVNSL